MQTRSASTHAGSSSAQPFWASKTALAGATALTAGSLSWYAHQYGSIPFVDNLHANMVDEGLHSPKYPWSHNGIFDSFDHAS